MLRLPIEEVNNGFTYSPELLALGKSETNSQLVAERLKLPQYQHHGKNNAIKANNGLFVKLWDLNSLAVKITLTFESTIKNLQATDL